MSHWNFRVMVTEHMDSKEYGIHEVYYDAKGNPNGWTENPTIVSDSVDGLVSNLKKMLEAVEKPILDKN